MIGGRVMRLALVTVAAILSFVVMSAAAAAQTTPRLRVVVRTPIVDAPRGDGFVLGVVDAGSELEVYGRRGRWLEVRTPTTFPQGRGWIESSAIQMLVALPGPPAPPKGKRMMRAFGTVGATLFTAKESTEAIFGSSSGLMFGGGAQFVFPSGAFVMAGYEQFEKTGTRVLVSGSQVFTLPIDTDIRITPLHFTLGYRDFKTRVAQAYLGAGAGWVQLRERAADGATFSKSHVSGHVIGGVERQLGSFFAVAGEIQWTGVPGIIGESGVSAVVGEDDLGGTTFRAKIIIGR